MDDVLELSASCRLEFCKYGGGVSLLYTEHQADSWYSDMETDIDIDRDKAMEIIEWLREKCDIREEPKP